MKISFVLLWAYGMGGLVRTTVNTANHFAEQGHDVELITFFKHRDDPFFAIRPDVKITPLRDTRKGVEHSRLEEWQIKQESRFSPRSENLHDNMTLRGDYMLWRTLRSTDADVLITTRPAFNLAAAMWAPPHTITIGQDHLNFTKHPSSLRWQMQQWYPRLDAMATLTEADRADYEKMLAGAPTKIVAIGNAVAGGEHPHTTQENPVVVTAGRLVHQKRYDDLVRAFAIVRESRPDWQLKIFGDGSQQAMLKKLIAELGVGDNVKLMGRTSDIEGEFAQASIMAMSSRFEGYPMVILEAFGGGLPVVSYDCPRGPGEMITSGHDGLVVENSNPQALATGLLELINDPELRRKMSANALDTARRYSIDEIGARWEALFADLAANRVKRPAHPFVPVIKRRVLAARPRRAQRARWSK